MKMLCPDNHLAVVQTGIQTRRIIMNLKSSLGQLALLFAFTVAAVIAASADDKVVLESMKLGDNYVRNVRVKNVTPTDVTILYEGGGTQLKRKDLSEPLKGLYPYDPQAAAAYEKQQAEERLRRAEEAKIRQEQASRDLMISLQKQQYATRNRIADMEKQLRQLEKEIGPMKGKARGKRNSAARAELDSALEAQQDLIHRIGEQKSFLDKLNKQLDLLP
jgi:hypothetical protein